MRRITQAAAFIVVICLLLASCGKNKTLENSSSAASDIVSDYNIPADNGETVKTPAEESVSSGEIITDDLSGMDFTVDNKDISSEYDESNATDITPDTDNKKKTPVNITDAGTYVISGEVKDTAITVKAADTDEVRIVLDNADINNSKGPAIYVKSAAKVFITLKDGTVNSVSDGSFYSYIDGSTTADAAIFCKSDLTVNGSGELNIKGNYKHGIVSKDDLIITAGNIKVEAKNVGINGKNCVKISSGNFEIVSGSDGIRSDNTEDAGSGYVYIEGGSVKITSENDGIQAQSAIKIENADISITSGGGSGGTLLETSESSKGMKAASDIIISSGTFSIDTLDDCIHSDNTVSISGGILELKSSDDGIHADTDLSVSGGEINIPKCNEGLEGSRVFVSGGNIAITALDDGINAAGGSDTTATDDDSFTSSSGDISISGGYTYIDASGDGIDAKGTFTLSGGIALVSGAITSGSKSFDYDAQGVLTGGTLVALGGTSTKKGFESAENQASVYCKFATQAAGTSIALCDSSGDKALVFLITDKKFSTAVITSPEIIAGGSYSLVAGAQADALDENGFAQNVAVTGGKILKTINITELIYE